MFHFVYRHLSQVYTVLSLQLPVPLLTTESHLLIQFFPPMVSVDTLTSWSTHVFFFLHLHLLVVATSLTLATFEYIINFLFSFFSDTLQLPTQSPNNHFSLVHPFPSSAAMHVSM